MLDREQRLREEASRGEEAARLLENPMLSEALSLMEAHLIQRLKKEGDRELQARLTDQLQATESVGKCLRRTIETGKLAVHELKQKGWW